MTKFSHIKTDAILIYIKRLSVVSEDCPLHLRGFNCKNCEGRNNQPRRGFPVCKIFAKKALTRELIGRGAKHV